MRSLLLKTIVSCKTSASHTGYVTAGSRDARTPYIVRGMSTISRASAMRPGAAAGLMKNPSHESITKSVKRVMYSE